MKTSIKGMDLPQLGTMFSDCLQSEQRNWAPRIYRPSALSEGTKVSSEQRDHAVQWMLQLTHRFRWNPETFVLSVSILDKFLATVRAHPKYLRCIAITCLYLAAKIHEEDEIVPGTSEIVRESRCGCSVREVLRMERAVLDKLHWAPASSTALDFLHIFHMMLLKNNPSLLENYSHMTPSHQIAALTTKLKICLTQSQLGVFRPATVALSLLSLELEFYISDWLTSTVALQKLAGIDSHHLIRCREIISSCFAQYHNRNIVYKYSPEAMNKRAKRKMSESDCDDPDIYDGIKRLYNEEPTDAACGASARQEAEYQPPPLQPISAN